MELMTNKYACSNSICVLFVGLGTLGTVYKHAKSMWIYVKFEDYCVWFTFYSENITH